MVDQNHFQRFSGKFATVEQLSSPKTFVGVAFEDGDNQCIGLYLSQRLPFGCRFHQYDCAAKPSKFEILPILEFSVLAILAVIGGSGSCFYKENSQLRSTIRKHLTGAHVSKSCNEEIT